MNKVSIIIIIIIIIVIIIIISMTDTENTALEKLCPSLSEQRIIYSVVEIKIGLLRNYWRFRDTFQTIIFY